MFEIWKYEIKKIEYSYDLPQFNKVINVRETRHMYYWKCRLVGAY